MGAGGVLVCHRGFSGPVEAERLIEPQLLKGIHLQPLYLQQHRQVGKRS